MSVMVVTSLGDFVVDLFTDRCPLTCKNFLKLCKIKYYNGCLFHNVQKDFTAQTGDPTGTGSGGDSVYKFLYGDQARFFGDEIHLDLKHSEVGAVAMASGGENLNASQFYITLREDLDSLDGKHTVFGRVAEGLETLQRINEAYVDQNSRPFKNIRIKHTYVLDDPFDDPPQLAELVPEASPEGKPKDEVDDDVRLEDDWVPLDEQLNTDALEEIIREKEAHSRAVVLETVGDLPEAEVKPPDNVLFVCKLNPVTEDEDLHTIFSRFGTVTSAEIIRDYKTGDSLSYAFIEFEDKKACEEAYFKMDNALIDDRRIHVDFSQSVMKLWAQYRSKMHKGKGCYKCGSGNHIAKECTTDSTNGQLQQKYVLKDGNTQHGGSDKLRYEMVFDGDAAENPKSGKRRKYDEQRDNEHGGKERPNRERSKSDGGIGSYRGDKKDPRKEPREERRLGDDIGVYEKRQSASSYRDQKEDTQDRKRQEYDPSHRNKMDRREYQKGYVDDRQRERRETKDDKRSGESRRDRRNGSENEKASGVDKETRDKRGYEKGYSGDSGRHMDRMLTKEVSKRTNEDDDRRHHRRGNTHERDRSRRH